MLYHHLRVVFYCLIAVAFERVNSSFYDSPKKPPNIVFFLVDDWGHFDINLNGMKAIPTTNLNRLAREGVYLNNFYTPPVCTPSRASLLTGLYDSNTEMQHFAIADTQPAALPIRFKILPQWLKEKRYVTNMVGKWHLGYYKREFTPYQRGFDHFFGFWNGNCDMFHHHSVQTSLPATSFINLPADFPRDPSDQNSVLLEGYDLRYDMAISQRRQPEYLTDLFTEEAVNIIGIHNASKPLFLYIAHQGVHRSNMQYEMRSPYKYTKYFDHIQDRERKQYAGALTAIDISLGKVVAALARQQMLDNTIIVVQGDNGAPRRGGVFSNGGSNFPLRGYKTSTFQGGTKVTSFIWSPLIKNSRSIFNGLMHNCDWLPTLYAAAGGKVSDLGPIDGINMWDAISKGEKPARTELLVHYDQISNTSAFILNNFKLVSGVKYIGLEGTKTQKPESELTVPDTLCSPPDSTLVDQVFDWYYAFQDPVNIKPYADIQPVKCSQSEAVNGTPCTLSDQYCLFNLNEDPCEVRNIAQQQPKILRVMMNKLKFNMDKAAPAQNPPNDFLFNPDFYGGVWLNYQDYLKPETPCSTFK